MFCGKILRENIQQKAGLYLNSTCDLELLVPLNWVFNHEFVSAVKINNRYEGDADEGDAEHYILLEPSNLP